MYLPTSTMKYLSIVPYESTSIYLGTYYGDVQVLWLQNISDLKAKWKQQKLFVVKILKQLNHNQIDQLFANKKVQVWIPNSKMVM